MVCGHRHQVGRRKRSGRSEGYAGMGDASLGAKSKLKGSVRCQTAAKGLPARKIRGFAVAAAKNQSGSWG